MSINVLHICKDNKQMALTIEITDGKGQATCQECGQTVKAEHKGGRRYRCTIEDEGAK